MSAKIADMADPAGDDCFWMKLRVRSVGRVEEVIDRFTPYGRTTTSMIQSSPVPRRGAAF